MYYTAIMAYKKHARTSRFISRFTILAITLLTLGTYLMTNQVLAAASSTNPCQPSVLNPNPNNTAVIQVLCQGTVHCGPTSINNYYLDVYNGVQLCSQKAGTVQDAYGFFNDRCGSYAAWMVSQEQEQMPNYAQVGMPGSWPQTIPQYFPAAKIVTNPLPGDIAVRATILDSNGQPILIDGRPDPGHAMYIVKSNWHNEHYLEVNAYNGDGQGNFSQEVWNPAGGTLTVNNQGTTQSYNFNLVFFRFPPVSQAIN